MTYFDSLFLHSSGSRKKANTRTLHTISGVFPIDRHWQRMGGTVAASKVKANANR